MGSFKKLCSIEEVRPEFSTVGLYRMLFITIKNKPDLSHLIIINTSTDDVEVARNTHVVNRVCDSADREIGFWIDVDVERTGDSLVASLILGSNENIVLSSFMFRLIVDVEFLLPAVFRTYRFRSDLSFRKSRYRQQSHCHHYSKNFF